MNPDPIFPYPPEPLPFEDFEENEECGRSNY